ncbi:MAG: hypothetical protein U9R47_03265 [Actinomycetota bacterium]|nr:hypothetical protein [Actinomycetota bacterium]
MPCNRLDVQADDFTFRQLAHCIRYRVDGQGTVVEDLGEPVAGGVQPQRSAAAQLNSPRSNDSTTSVIGSEGRQRMTLMLDGGVVSITIVSVNPGTISESAWLNTARCRGVRGADAGVAAVVDVVSALGSALVAPAASVPPESLGVGEPSSHPKTNAATTAPAIGAHRRLRPRPRPGRGRNSGSIVI